ncbi:MAG TPA: hypothetical protein PKA06_10935, partial [Gemmatales bacterium]|nr:hypothetical protein [Gemmatales bacterium]
MRESWWFARLCWWVVVVGLVLGPLVLPLGELAFSPGAWLAWKESSRFLSLLLNTLGIAAGSSLFALLLKFPAAFLLARTSLRARRVWMLLLAVTLVIPLPALLAGWYVVAQSLGAPLPALWPWELRWLGTILLHGCIGLPWVVGLLSLGLLWVEPNLEEEMLLYASLPRVLLWVILPRLWPCLCLALLVASWPAWHEITVTDFFQVRTFAEEVYLQLNGSTQEEFPRAMAVALPWMLLFMLLSGWQMRRWQRQLPSVLPSLARPRRLPLQGWQTLAQLWMLLIISLLLVIPTIGLLRRAGMEYNPEPHWSLSSLLFRWMQAVVTPASPLWRSLFMATVAGALTACSILLLVWLARSSAFIQKFSWWLMAGLWAIPGPLLGLGLLSYVMLLIRIPGLSPWLYSEPSPWPNIWVAWLRFAPLVWMVLWPLAVLIPRQLEEASRLDGATPWNRFLLHYYPALRRPAWLCLLAVTLLTLGEISASKLVTTPGFLPLSHHLFQLI